MNFHNLCKFYISNYDKIRNKKTFMKLLLIEHEFYQLKKRRAKLGHVKFEMEQIFFQNYLIHTTFEMVFSRQPGTQRYKNAFKATLEFYSWAWDFKNVVTLALFIGLFAQVVNHEMTIMLELWFTDMGEFIDWEEARADYLNATTRTSLFSTADLFSISSQLLDVILLIQKK